MMAVLSQMMSGGFSLRRRGDSQGTQGTQGTETGEVDGPSSRLPGLPRQPPSLAEILSARKGLKKTAVIPEKKEFKPHDTFPFLGDIREGRFALRKKKESGTL